MPLRTCQAVGCSHPVQTSRFMCRPHWLALPYPLRRQINETWGKRQRASKSSGVRTAAPFVIAHVEACDEARRWTAEGEGRIAEYQPDAARLTRLYALASEDDPGRPVPPHGSGP